MVIRFTNWKHLFKLFAALFFLIFICEFLIYYLVLLQCSWPDIQHAEVDQKIQADHEKPVRVMILADTHLLGVVLGHWWDKLRREWQMYRSFQTAMTIHSPEVIFFLGDLFDEGKWASKISFQKYVDRFNSLFHHSDSKRSYVVAGNHDIGFHIQITPTANERFWREFKAAPVQHVTVRGNQFVLINSMAMEGDDCFLCSSAMKRLHKISNEINCQNKVGNNCSEKAKYYSRPIIMQHFPLYRKSDKKCKVVDEEILGNNDYQKFRPKWECLSNESTEFLLRLLNPRAVFSGHSHHSCFIYHKDIPEWTVASFNWRNKQRPSFILAVFAANRFVVDTCYLPDENVVISLYIFGVFCIAAWFLITGKQFVQRHQYKAE